LLSPRHIPELGGAEVRGVGPIAVGRQGDAHVGRPTEVADIIYLAPFGQQGKGEASIERISHLSSPC